MKTHCASRLGLAILGLALAAAAAAAPPKSNPQRAPAPAPCNPGEPAFWRDQGLTTKVSVKLQFHKPLLREHVEVKVVGGAAILSGNLSSQRLIDEAVRAAGEVGGVQCVQSYLQVGPPLPRNPS